MNYKEAKELNFQLLHACDEYYNIGYSSLSDKEYDRLYDELVEYEKEHGTIPCSVTQMVGAAVTGKLPKVEHELRALSLNKSKDPDDIIKWAAGQDLCVSWKLDGLTLVLTYNDGILTSAVTRGNGIVGEDVTHNAYCIIGIPLTIPWQGHVIVRGEVIASYQGLKKVNKELGQNYSVPRSLAAGSVRLLDSKETKKRYLYFKAFELVYPRGESFCEDLEGLEVMGFSPVACEVVEPAGVKQAIQKWTGYVETFPLPVDGLVFMIDDIREFKARGSTDKFPNGGMAFKWADETYETTVRRIQWQVSKTGRINPVVCFDPVEIDGSIVSRATGNNVTFLQEKQIGVGSVISVYKANMIIPTIDEVLENPQMPDIPEVCPKCGRPTKIEIGPSGSKILCCDNPNCISQKIEKFKHLAKRSALNIVGMGESIIEELFSDPNVDIQNFSDIIRLSQQKEYLSTLLGCKRTANLLESIETARHTTLARFIYAMSIPGVGRRASGDIANYCGDYHTFWQIACNTPGEFENIPGIGEKIAQDIHEWTKDTSLYDGFADLMFFEDIQGGAISPVFAGMTFVITGKLNKFSNRDECVKYIESRGGKTAGSVSAKTTYLVNNDVESTSGKNKKAKSLGIPIISEKQLIEMGKSNE